MFERIFAWALCGALALFPVLASAQSPIRAFPPGVFQNRAAMDAAPIVGYQGPGDIVSGALAWGSCSRVYSVSLASTSTSMCDLVDTATGTVAICTLRGSSTGFVDLAGSYCVGSTTPATACAAAAGGACRVSKVNDQIGGTSGWINATNSTRPTLTFSAINGLPGITCTAAANSLLATSTTFGSGGTVAISSPFTWVAVAERNNNTGVEQSVLGWTTSPNGLLGFNNAAATAVVTADNASKVTLGSVADNAFHAMIGIVNSTTTGVLAVDGIENTGTTATSVPANVTSRLCRSAGGISLDGFIMEAGLWGSAITNRSGLNSNMHGTSGYNFP